MKATLLGDTPARYVSQMFYSDMNERKKEEGLNARPHAGTRLTRREDAPQSQLQFNELRTKRYRNRCESVFAYILYNTILVH